MTEPNVTWLHRVVGFLGALYLRLVHLTSFVRHNDHPHAQEIRRKRHPAIYAFWHNNQVYLAYDHRKEPIHVLVSQSKDGEFIAQVLEWMGMKTARGSTSKGGTQALRKICQVLKDGDQAGFTPDGPRGPVQTVHGGLIAAARLSGCPIVPIAVSPRRKIVFNSWDKFFVPLPFNSIAVSHGQPFVLKRDIPESDAENIVRQALNAVVDDAQSNQELMPSWGVSLFGQLLFVIYSLISVIFLPLIIPILIMIFGGTRSLRYMGERITAPRMASSNKKRIWFHLASYGEWQALYPIFEKFKSCELFDIVITTNAPEARRLIGEKNPDVCVRLCPVDLLMVVSSWIGRVSPDVLILVEKEFWPRILAEVRLKNIPVFVVNGRFSNRSHQRWAAVKPLVSWLFAVPSMFIVRSIQDQNNFAAMGVPQWKISTVGNSKYDTLSALTDLQKNELKQNLLGLSEKDVVVIGGSTWDGEELALLGCTEKLILAPRRMSRVEQVVKLIQSSGKTWSRWSQMKGQTWKTQILLVDTLGDLKNLYSTADIAFVGGSLISHGGQSPLEPAAAGLPVLFGPSMENFKEESEDLLNRGAAIQVRDGGHLRQEILALLSDSHRRKKMAQLAQEAIRCRQGASHRTVQTILTQLGINNGG